MTDEPKKYFCVFCHFCANQMHFGCPNCGRQFGYGKARVVKTIVMAQGILFTLIGGFLFFVGLKILISELHLPYEMAPWWIFVIMFSIAAVFTVGGISSFFGKTWLLRFLLFLFARNAGSSTSPN
jgi:hypothetical protein